MNKDLQRKAIAEACGFDTFPMHREFKSGWVIPDYLGDLNACHEMEKELTEEEQGEYWIQLSEVVGNLGTCFNFAHSTAIQRSECFLRVKGLWVDTP